MTKFTCRASLCALFALVALLLTGVGNAQPYSIDSFDTEIQLEPSSRFSVSESLNVTFTESRRGIFRKIPIHYQTRTGVTRSIFISNIRVTNADGENLEFRTEREGSNLIIRIGNPDVFLDPGTNITYVISYDVDNAINWFDQGQDWMAVAELYWNITGNEWDVPIQQTRFRITFPEAAQGEGLRARVFTGVQGSTESDSVIGLQSSTLGRRTQTTLSMTENSFSGERLVPLGAGEGLTVVLQVPEPLVPKPPFWVHLMHMLRSNLGFTLPIWIFLGFLLLWLRYGRDPKVPRLYVRFEPPDGLSGPECGTLIDERVDRSDVVSAIFALAVKGYLKIHPKETGWLFKSRSCDIELTGKRAKDDLTSLEEYILSLLAAKQKDMLDQEDLRAQISPKIDQINSRLYKMLVDKHYFRKSPQDQRTTWGFFGVTAVIVLAVLFVIIHPYHEVLPSIVGAVIGLFVVGAFVPRMPNKTHQGALAAAEVRAFEEFIKKGGDRTEWLAKKHPDAAMFEEYLPHAIAFGLVQEWTKMFDGILTAPPDWYAGPQTGFAPALLAADLAILNSAIQTATIPPRTSGTSGAGGGYSGFGGGGFSGGGFGGGGGGSW